MRSFSGWRYFACSRSTGRNYARSSGVLVDGSFCVFGEFEEGSYLVVAVMQSKQVYVRQLWNGGRRKVNLLLIKAAGGGD